MSDFKRRFWFFLFCMICIVSPVCAADQASVELAQLLSQYQSYQALFVQTTFQMDGSRPQISSGEMMMERPGKFRWEIHKPMKQVIIANGDDLWVYDETLQQATLQKVSAGVGSPAYLLSNDAVQLMKQYQVTRVKREGKLWYQLKPISKESDFVLIQMYFSGNKLSAMWIKNNLGVISQFTFHEIKLNKPLRANFFKFTPPPGVDVLK